MGKIGSVKGRFPYFSQCQVNFRKGKITSVKERFSSVKGKFRPMKDKFNLIKSKFSSGNGKFCLVKSKFSSVKARSTQSRVNSAQSKTRYAQSMESLVRSKACLAQSSGSSAKQKWNFAELNASSSPPRATLELNDSVDSTKDHVPDSDSGALQQMLTLDCFNFKEPVRQTRQKEVCNRWIFLFVSFNFSRNIFSFRA